MKIKKMILIESISYKRSKKLIRGLQPDGGTPSYTILCIREIDTLPKLSLGEQCAFLKRLMNGRLNLMVEAQLMMCFSAMALMSWISYIRRSSTRIYVGGLGW